MIFGRAVFCAVLAAPFVILLSPQSNSQESEPDSQKYERPAFAHEKSDLKPDPRVLYGELPNGLRYAVMENDTPEGTASMRLRIAVGSLTETEEERGLAHFLEHMAFNGSKNIPEGEMTKRLERHGLSFGGDTNAHTGFYETVYKLNLPNVDDEVVDEAFMLMRETASNLTLAPDAIERERGIIRSEKRASESVSNKHSLAVMEFYNRGNELMDRLPIGTDETIDNLQAEHFRAFYNANYHPEKAFFVFVGDLPAEQVIAQIEATFGDWQGVTDPTPLPVLSDIAMRPGDVGYYFDPEIMPSVQFAVLVPYEWPDGDTRETRRNVLVRAIAQGMFMRRLGRLCYAPDSIVSGCSASLRGRASDKMSISSISIRPSAADNWVEALSFVEPELRRTLTFGFDQSEMDLQVRAIRERYKNNANGADTTPTHAWLGSGMVDRILRAYGSESVLEHPRDALARLNEDIETVTLEEVERAFNAAWVGAEAPMIFLSLPKEVEHPQAAVLNAFQLSQSVPVSKRDDLVATEFAYNDFGPVGEIVERNYLPDVDAHTVRFANNVLLTVKQTDFVDDEVLIAASVGDGSLSLPRKDEGLRRLALNLLSRGGLKAHSIIELSDIISDWGISFMTFVPRASNSISLRGEAVQSDLPRLLNLLTAYASAPGLRKDVVANYKRNISLWYPTHDSTPRDVASKEIPRIIRSGDLRFGFSDLENFLAADWEEASTWIREQLTQGMIEIAIVGDIPVEDAIGEVARTFGALPTRRAARGAYPDATILKFPERKQDIITLTHAGEDHKALLRIYWPAPDGSDPKRSQIVRLLANVFRGRLVEEIREKDAATYSPGAGFYNSPIFSNYGYMVASLELAPEAVQSIIDRVEGIADELYRGEISQDEFERAMNPVREDLPAQLQSNGYWTRSLLDVQSDQFGLARHQAIIAAPDEITVEDVRTIAKKVFEPGKSVRIQVVPQTEEEDA